LRDVGALCDGSNRRELAGASFLGSKDDIHDKLKAHGEDLD
jgi:hypothetical protein